ncbi:GAF domain-containing protein [Marimonas sp. MJW-29]|uniref:GAF domain-containing protein n=1 Tax=Sulfitobacter sediminis TaxID=3234186 RepID=A0ABV3RM59_9RHOB
MAEDADLEHLLADLARGHEREAAMRNILDVISQSREDEGPVFDAILSSAAKLCNAPMAWLLLVNESQTELSLAAYHGLTRRALNIGQTWPMDLSAELTGLGQAIAQARTVQDEDLSQSSAYLAGEADMVQLVDEEGLRTRISVPLVKGTTCIGIIVLSRREVSPFADDEIRLVDTFAGQAVIAIQNVRQFRELQTQLEREAATREILQVISQSRDDDGPVFDVILANAERLCNATGSGLQLVDDARTMLTIVRNGPGTNHGAFPDGTTFDLNEPLVMCAAVREGKVQNIPDMKDTDLYRSGHEGRRKLVDVEGVRAHLSVPLMRDSVAFGNITLSRPEPRAFSPEEIHLVQTFAAQAVIAIDNVRQFHEVQTRLEREAATREILQVISQSPDDEGPVFDAILQKASQLCNVPDAALMLLTPTGTHYRIRAHRGLIRIDLAETREWAVADPLPISQAFREARTIHIADMTQSAPYLAGDPTYLRMVDDEGLRSRLCVPLMLQGKAFGVIALSRYELAPFSKGEIDLIETFAAQAVIAIENVRQFREVQTRLERERASREILQVISASRTDPAPVFDIILKNAAHLSGAPLANLCLLDAAGHHWHLVAHFGEGLRHLSVGSKPRPLDNQLVPSVAMRTAQVVHIEDLTDTDLYRQRDPGRVAMVEEEGMRTILCVPLLLDEAATGCITLFRREVKAFSHDEITLLETFAAQAVIAIENVRQFREVQERLARERASSEILQVISQSRDDESPVFETVLRNARQLCGADTAALMLGRPDDAHLKLAALSHADPARQATVPERIRLINQTPMEMDPKVHVSAAAICDGAPMNVADIKETDGYRKGELSFRMMVDKQGHRSMLSVPLLDARGALGAINLHRSEPGLFTEDAVALVQTFAAQAVIAIENVRQFRALETLNAELGNRVTEQVGEIERMGKLKRFLPAAVADTVVSSGSDSMLKSHRALLGVLFCDIRGFTAFCETAEPEETIEVLQTYHEEMGKLINAHGAGVDHRMGDGIMVLFNDPIPCDDPAGDAVRLAIAMRTRMAELGRDWKRMGFRLGFGVGVSMGYATVGMVGYEGRSDYTASGTAINLASRLCEMAEDGEILLSTRAAIAVEDDFPSVTTGEVTLKGIREPVEVFRLSDIPAG